MPRLLHEIYSSKAEFISKINKAFFLMLMFNFSFRVILATVGFATELIERKIALGVLHCVLPYYSVKTYRCEYNWQLFLYLENGPLTLRKWQTIGSQCLTPLGHWGCPTI